MANTSGTATGYLDLLDKFSIFVTTGLAAGQNWTKLLDHTTEAGYDRNIYFKAPGLAGTDQIFINAAALHNTGADTFNVGFYGASAFNAALGGLLVQPGLQPNGSWLLMWNTTIPYWFIADGRSAKIVAKVSTVYESAYAGLYIPYASPSEYAYPLFVGACASNPARRYSDTSTVFSSFWNPTSDGQNSLQVDIHSGAWVRLPSGSWVPVGNGNTNAMRIWPYASFEQVGRVYGGTDYALMPLVLHTGSGVVGSPLDSQRGNMGELDGVFFISGFSNASENTVTIGGVTYLVVQNCFRTTGPSPTVVNQNQFAAFALT